MDSIDSTNLEKHTARILIFGISRDKTIVQFDHECQKITEYHRGDIIRQKTLDFLVPLRFIKRWYEQLEKIETQGFIQGVELPIKKKNGAEITILWDGFPLNTKSSDPIFCFIGTIPDSQGHSTQSLPYLQHGNSILHENDCLQNTFQDTIQTSFELNDQTITADASIDKKSPSNSRDIFNSRFLDTYDTHQEKADGTLKKMKDQDAMEKKIRDLSKKYSILNQKLKDLDKKNRSLERKNIQLEQNLQHVKKNQPSLNSADVSNNKIFHLRKKQLSKRAPKKGRFDIFDPFGFKRKKEEIAFGLQQLDQQRQELLKKESDLLRERKEIDQKIAEFSSWKEKLIEAEAEIEKRRNALFEEERLLQQQLEHLSPANEPVQSLRQEKSQEISEPQDLVSDLSECAAVVQRGILKQVNALFTDFIGFSSEELLEKSLFDFIAPEGLSDVERYYLNRLKGNDVSNYCTIFSTKNNEKKSAEVYLKPAIYKGEKAEITVIKQIKKEPNSEKPEK
ncbi:MAG: PAS domain S-box protein [Candidatus Thermoplasmatota archaeon]